jgi:lysyl-tRNA synthetase class 2
MDTEESILDQKKVRIEKLKKLKEMDVVPFAYGYSRTHRMKEISDENEKDNVSICGRIVAIRGHGKTVFADLQDESGKLQIYFRKDTIPEHLFKIVALLDIGDFIGSSGEIFKTRTGEVTLLVKDFTFLSKSLFPLPEKWHGLKDKEIRYRKRYLDIIMNEDVKLIFSRRARIIRTIRKILDDKGFMEVETPVLQPLYGGAFAQPFKTHYNVLDRNYFLRISDELYLKRLIIGGFEKLYEICKDFRNEGIDRYHNPEFTMMEVYEAYADYKDMMKLTEEIVIGVTEELFGEPIFEFQGKEIDVSGPWKKIGYFEGIERFTGEDISDFSRDQVFTFAKENGFEIEDNMSRGKILDEIYSEVVEPNLIQPTFVVDYPIEISPLAKKHRKESKLVERFEPVIAGMEIGNAFSELNDPFEQRDRFENQMKLKESGDEEVQQLDEDFIEAMEYGMPPTGGLGIGIDRLVMLLTDTPSIREVIIFPQLKTKK